MTDKSSYSGRNALEKLQQKQEIKTIISENGTEFAQHQQIAKMLNTNWYSTDSQNPH